MSVNTHGYASDPQPATGNCQPGTLVYIPEYSATETETKTKTKTKSKTQDQDQG